MQSQHEKMSALASEIETWGRVTQTFGWDHDPEMLVRSSHLGAKPIAQREWLRVMAIAVAIARALPHLPKPEVIAYSDGHTGLAWSQGERRHLVLQIFKVGQRTINGLVDNQSFAFEWEQMTEMGSAKHKANELHEVAQALAATLPKPSVLQ